MPQPSVLPLQLCWKNTWVLRSEVVGTGGGRQKGEGSTTMRSLHLLLSRLACAMAPGCGPMVLISFLPPRDNNSHCLCAHSWPVAWKSTFSTLCHFILTPSLGGGKRARCDLSAARLQSACGRDPAASARTLRRVSPPGRGIFLASSWTPTVTHFPLIPVGSLVLGAPTSPLPVSTIPSAASLPSGSLSLLF